MTIENGLKRATAPALGATTMLLAAVLPAPNGARAQTVNYGALEKLFAEPVTTSATGSPQRASDVPATMEIVTADDIRRSGAIDLPGVLRHVPGVDVLQWANSGADVSVRGYNQPYSSRLLVLIDGRQVYADFYGLTPWSALPVELGAIRQIEVVKGPNSALFGFNAVGGVINIITSNPLYDDVNAVSFGGGTQGLAEASVVSTLKLGDRAGIRIEAGGRSNDEFSTGPADSFIRRGNDRGSIDVNALVQIADGVQFGLEGSHTRADQAEMFPTLNTPGYTKYSTDSIKGQLTADTRLGLVQGTAYTNWIHADIASRDDLLNVNGTGSGAEPDLRAANEVTVVQLQDLFKPADDHTLRGSVEYRHNSVNTTPDEGGNVYYDVVSGGAMWDWKLAPSLSLTNAVRLDYLMLGRSGALPPGIPRTNGDWNRTLTQVSFNSGLVWQPDDVDTLRATASRGVQLPNLEDIGAIQQSIVSNGLTTLATGSPTLAPTIVTNYELGWDRTLPDFNAALRVSLFVQHTDSIVSNLGALTLLPAGILLTAANLGDSDAEGIELSLRGQIAAAWHWGLSYTPEIVTDHFAMGQASRLFVVDYQHTTPVHVVNASLGWTAGRWEVDGFLRYQSDVYGLAPAGSPARLTRIDNYVSIDGRVGYRLLDWATMSLSGQNIGQSRQRQTAAPSVERRVVGAIAVNF